MNDIPGCKLLIFERTERVGERLYIKDINELECILFVNEIKSFEVMTQRAMCLPSE
jgi:hypothetical protein